MSYITVSRAGKKKRIVKMNPVMRQSMCIGQPHLIDIFLNCTMLRDLEAQTTFLIGSMSHRGMLY